MGDGESIGSEIRAIGTEQRINKWRQPAPKTGDKVQGSACAEQDVKYINTEASEFNQKWSKLIEENADDGCLAQDAKPISTVAAPIPQSVALTEDDAVEQVL